MTDIAGRDPVPQDVRTALNSLAEGRFFDSYQSVRPGTDAGNAILEMYGHITDARHADTADEALVAINQAYVAGNSRLDALDSRDPTRAELVRETLHQLDALARVME